MKNCFITDSNVYNYDVTYDGEVIAKAHSLNYRDKMKHLDFFSMGTKDGVMKLLADPFPLIMSAVYSWTFTTADGKILEKTEDNLDKILPDIIISMATQIGKLEADMMAMAKDLEKN